MWPSYVINLAKNTRRMEASARQLDAAGVSWARVDAVWGADLPEAEVARVYDAARNARDGKHKLVAPEIGCYLSHIAAWRAIAEGEAPGGFIFEDDFAADATLADKLALLSEPQDMWDMVKLFSFDPAPRLVAEAALGDWRIGIPYRVPTCLIGYGVTRAAAARLAGRAIPFSAPWTRIRNSSGKLGCAWRWCCRRPSWWAIRRPRPGPSVRSGGPQDRGAAH